MDFQSKTLRCREVFNEQDHELKYDNLVIAVGAKNNTFGVPGVTKVCVLYSRRRQPCQPATRCLQPIKASERCGTSAYVMKLFHNQTQSPTKGKRYRTADLQE